MKTAAFLTALVGSAAAFAPAQQGARSTHQLSASSFDSDIGAATKELGMWDPLNLVDGKQENFDRLRASEIKNGRVAMMVCI